MLIETPPRRRSAGRDQDGPAGRRRGQPADQQGLRHADQQYQPHGPSRSTPPIRAPTTCFGHIIEMTPPDGDHAATQVQLGNPGQVRRSGGRRRRRHVLPDTTRDGWFGMPDNLRHRRRGPAVDCDRRQFGQGHRPRRRPVGDRDRRRRPRGTSSFSTAAPSGAELCGPCFTPDDETLFVAVQHPGEMAEMEGVRTPVDLRGPLDALARLRAGAAAAPVGRRHHQARQWQNRHVNATDILERYEALRRAFAAAM